MSIVYYVSPETLSQSFAEVPLEDAIDGIAVWKFNPQAINDNSWSGFRLPLNENRDTSAFYSDRKNTTSNVPRYVIYMNNWVYGDFEGLLNVFS